jgi:hypothetical protein
MVFRTHNLHNGSLKKRLSSKGQKNLFTESAALKNRIERNRLSAVLITRMALRTHNLNVLKCEFCAVAVSMFHDVERPFKRIFYILVIQKDLYEFPEMMS